MKTLDYTPALVAIYVDKSTLEFYNSIDLSKLSSLFTDKIRKFLPETKFYSNYSFSFSEKILDPNQKTIESESEFLQQILNILPESTMNSQDWDEVCFFYFRGIAPLLDVNLTESIWQRHKRYLSQYSYSENLPEGIVPKILTREFLLSLPPQLSQDSHEYFLKNINLYDVEIFFHPPDLRQYRLNLLPNDKRSFHLVNALIGKSEEIHYADILPQLEQNPNWFRSGPSWIEIEVHRGCELKCTFCPRQFLDNSNDGLYLNRAVIRDSIAQLDEFPTEYTVCFGGMGEPFLHQDLRSIITEVLKGRNLKELIIETALYSDWEIIQTAFENITELQSSKVTVIVNLTTGKQDRYTKLYGSAMYQKVLENLVKLETILPKKNIAVQLIKMLEIEDEVDSYFDNFEKKGYQIIFQKYNRFARLMPEKRVSDLTPMKREFCWHLARELYINADGSVSICRQLPSSSPNSPDSKFKQIGNMQNLDTIGNIKMDRISDIWEKGLSSFKSSFLGDHEGTGAPCMECDEWYTFNG
ncbi:spiro-SPASM protein [Leptospira sp. GIMC2001]|uniref:spiro-SPASM protein n=1 Tax=Leptospira sp. GIMC2001 TaxID=1513297 RepID=UPI00234BE240|nr:spiro-SPASM protein [Leptospira sp. GIMC2001]WCL49653.1 spiro-SPASM protein [Leptospira sp. GIMC2001]